MSPRRRRTGRAVPAMRTMPTLADPVGVSGGESRGGGQRDGVERRQDLAHRLCQNLVGDI